MYRSGETAEDKRTLESALKHLDDILSPDKNWECEECRNEHIQLRELLRELEQYRQIGGRCRIYISGPITGTEDHIERFAIAQEYLESLRFEVVNPAKVLSQMPAMTHAEYMQMCMTMLELCDAIYMLKDWETSEGAAEEFDKAGMLELPMMFERPPAGQYRERTDGN